MMAALYIIGFMVTFSICGAFYYVFKVFLKNEALRNQVEDDQIEIETQKKYLEISSRPESSANDILGRMRKESASSNK